MTVPPGNVKSFSKGSWMKAEIHPNSQNFKNIMIMKIQYVRICEIQLKATIIRKTKDFK